MDSHGGAVSRKVKECKPGFRKFPKYSGMELRAQLLSRGRVALPPSLREGRRVGSCREEMGLRRAPRPPQWFRVNTLLHFALSAPPHSWQETRQVSPVGHVRGASILPGHRHTVNGSAWSREEAWSGAGPRIMGTMNYSESASSLNSQHLQEPLPLISCAARPWAPREKCSSPAEEEKPIRQARGTDPSPCVRRVSVLKMKSKTLSPPAISCSLQRPPWPKKSSH